LIRGSKHCISKISPPISLRLFDGSLVPNGPISMYADIDFSLPGSVSVPHWFHFLVTHLDSSISMVLGYNWLAAHNPEINWHTGCVTLCSLLVNMSLRMSLPTESGTSAVLLPFSPASSPHPPFPSPMPLNIQLISA